jgi:hypothetical protein
MKRLVYLGYLATDSTYVSDGDHLELQQVDMQVGSTAQRCVNRSYVMYQAVISSDRDPDRPP